MYTDAMKLLPVTFPIQMSQLFTMALQMLSSLLVLLHKSLMFMLIDVIVNFVNPLEDNIIQRGAPNKLIGAQVIISNKFADFVNPLADNIIQQGAPNKLISDRAQVIISNKFADILRTLCIANWQSEPRQQHQNLAERRYQTIKNCTSRVIDHTGAPVYVCLYVFSISAIYSTTFTI
jgi:hypothetical protein